MRTTASPVRLFERAQRLTPVRSPYQLCVVQGWREGVRLIW